MAAPETTPATKPQKPEGDSLNPATPIPTQKKFWLVVRSDNGNTHTYNGANKINTHEEAVQHSIAMASANKYACSVLECIGAVQPKAAIDHIKIVD